MDCLLRPARPEELSELADLINRAFRGTGPDASWNTESLYIDGDRTALHYLEQDLKDHPEAFLLIAQDNDASAICGCVWLQPEASATWYLGTLTVDPRQQKAGLGRKLLEAAERWAADHGARTMRMRVVNVRHTLIAWYERRGYKFSGETQPFPYGDNRFGTPKRDDLQFVILEKAL